MSMNVLDAISSYLDRVIGDPKLSGMKALLLDEETSRISSLIYSQTEVMEKEVYLVEYLGASRNHEPMHHLKASILCRPTIENVNRICKELGDARFGEYHIYFTNILPKKLLKKIANADSEGELVRQVQEVYADFLAINEDTFSAGAGDLMPISLGMASTSPLAVQAFERSVSATLAVLLALKRCPSQIRYAAGSSLARRSAMEVNSRVSADDIFDFQRREGPLLLFLDRRDDCVTPLLNQWTYQAMVHELLGLDNNRVSLKGSPGIRKELEEVVLSCTQDNFFAKNRYKNFGDLGVAVKNLIDEYQKATKLNENLQSIEDMQAFLDRYPAFRSQSLNVSKHVAVLSELARLVEQHGLLDVSSFEQDLACDNDHSNHYKMLMDKLSNARVQKADKLRLALLYALRYEESGNLQRVRSKLLANGLTKPEVDIIDIILKHGGKEKRSSCFDVEQHSIMRQLEKRITIALAGVENVYSKHIPVLLRVVESAMKGKLKDKYFPAVIIVFVMGGITFEESTKIAEFNASLSSGQVLLGGSCIHNSTSFLAELSRSYAPDASIQHSFEISM